MTINSIDPLWPNKVVCFLQLFFNIFIISLLLETFFPIFKSDTSDFDSLRDNNARISSKVDNDDSSNKKPKNKICK